jgi:hypothetical protein
MDSDQRSAASLKNATVYAALIYGAVPRTEVLEQPHTIKKDVLKQGISGTNPDIPLTPFVPGRDRGSAPPVRVFSASYATGA